MSSACSSKQLMVLYILCSKYDTMNSRHKKTSLVGFSLVLFWYWILWYCTCYWRQLIIMTTLFKQMMWCRKSVKIFFRRTGLMLVLRHSGFCYLPCIARSAHVPWTVSDILYILYLELGVYAVYVFPEPLHNLFISIFYN